MAVLAERQLRFANPVVHAGELKKFLSNVYADLTHDFPSAPNWSAQARCILERAMRRRCLRGRAYSCVVRLKPIANSLRRITCRVLTEALNAVCCWACF